jgi:hypothetical protein
LRVLSRLFAVDVDRTHPVGVQILFRRRPLGAGQDPEAYLELDESGREFLEKALLPTGLCRSNAGCGARLRETSAR